MVPVVLQSFSLTLYKTDTIWKWTPRDGPGRSMLSPWVFLSPGCHQSCFPWKRVPAVCYAKQEKKQENRYSTFLKFSERGTKPLKNRYIFHRDLKYFSKVSCHRPRGPTPYLFIYQFCQKRYPFSYTIYRQIVPLTCLVWNLILLKMHCLLLRKIVLRD